MIVETLRKVSLPNPRIGQVSVCRIGRGVANGTFGELLQGALRNEDDHFLVTLPIRKFSTAVFTPDLNSGEITVVPGHKSKSARLALRLLDQLGLKLGGRLSIDSELPEGKGMASSSADLVATVRALEDCLQQLIPSELLLSSLRSIEPTDGVMYHEFVTFFHRRVELGRRLGLQTQLRILAIDAGGKIDTIEYNQRHSLFTDEECAEYRVLLADLEEAILKADLESIGRIATRSAVLNQRRNPNPYLDQMIAIGRETGALGVVAAHSGPCLGLLFPLDSGRPAELERLERAESLLTRLTGQFFMVESLAPPGSS